MLNTIKLNNSLKHSTLTNIQITLIKNTFKALNNKPQTVRELNKTLQVSNLFTLSWCLDWLCYNGFAKRIKTTIANLYCI